MARKLEVEIVGDASSLRRAVGQADSSSSKLGSTFKSLGKVGLLAAGAAGVGALVYTLKTGIGEFMQSQKVAAQTRAVIKSTGGAARVTAKDVDTLAGSLMKKSGVDDEAIAAGENMLLTFTKIRNEVGKGNDVFKQATKATLDLSVATGKDMVSSSVLVGKALNDPIKGITALTRVGVSFTDGQRKSIKAMVEHGNVLGAQKIILKELNKEFGGSAEALGNTLPGMINIAKESFNNWAGELVAKMIPVIKETIAWLRDHWPEITAKVQAFWAAIKPTLDALRVLFISIVQTIRQHWGTIGPIVMAVAAIVKANLAVIAAAIRFVSALIRGDWSGAWRALKDVASSMANLVKAVVGAAFLVVKTAIAGVVTELGRLATWLGHRLSPPPGVDKIIEAFSRIYGWLRRITGTAWTISVHFNVPSIPKLPGGLRYPWQAKAAGGAVMRGRGYIVGERGPEFFSPGTNGTITPNHKLGGGGMQTINLMLDGRTLASVLFDPLRGEVAALRRSGGTF